MSRDWRKVILTPRATIQEAIEVIDRESLRLALVVDTNFFLLGTITDGDVRRAMIKRISLDARVDSIMNTSPRVAAVGDSSRRLLALMEREGLLHIPLLEDGKLAGLETLEQLLIGPKYDNPVLLMAGGFGTRLRPLTDTCPKPLLKVGNKAILETILESFIEAGFHSFYISTHYRPEMIRDYFGAGEKWGVDIRYLHETTPLGTGGALGLLPDSLPDLPLIVMNGDVLTKVDFGQLLRYHNERNAAATMCVREYSYQIPYGVIKAEGDRITNVIEKPRQTFFVNAGIYVLGKEVIDSVQGLKKIDMPALLEEQIANDKRVSMFPLHEYWLDIGKMNDFEKAQIDFIRDFS